MQQCAIIVDSQSSASKDKCASWFLQTWVAGRLKAIGLQQQDFDGRTERATHLLSYVTSCKAFSNWELRTAPAQSLFAHEKHLRRSQRWLVDAQNTTALCLRAA